ncbi:YlmH/Sll1252 family protein [Paenibacillus sp. SC116]|uniref:YlmH family RNA-binding protein n=1 Tax=Paenibacillus sp. SC116 TaxID=2968986 RepID=UPI00215AF6B6|nr:YlmH/Sll1252 family protein [Paenibacillus sp. SC116]MCR8845732.1 YlmH/Sll1252 family protein [Paenibacillus sp. SC116]
MSEQIKVHFHPDERPFVDRASEWMIRAAERHEVRLTDFLDPRQAYIVQTLVNRRDDIALRVDGGYEGAERCRAIIAPEYVYVEAEPMDMTVLSISSSDQRMSELEHGDYLGALLGLGIKRDKIGDIHTSDAGAHVLVTEDIASFLDTHLRQVHRVPVFTDLVPLTELRVTGQEWKPFTISVASMRLDGIVSDVFRLSRAKITAPIKNGRCKVNWKVEENPSVPLTVGDVVSLQGFGRFKVLEIEGVSKKGRMRVMVGTYQ